MLIKLSSTLCFRNGMALPVTAEQSSSSGVYTLLPWTIRYAWLIQQAGRPTADSHLPGVPDDSLQRRPLHLTGPTGSGVSTRELLS